MQGVSGIFQQAKVSTYNTTNIDELKRTFASGRTKSYEWRVAQLNALRRLIEENTTPIIEALYADLGKCKTEAWLTEIGYSTASISDTVKRLKSWMKPNKINTPLIAQPGKSYTINEPLGVVLISGAWNYPFQLVVTPLIAAIAAGNCAVKARV